MSVGTKIEPTIYATAFGLHFFDSITSVLCSFYEQLPNEVHLEEQAKRKFRPLRKNPNAAPIPEDYSKDIEVKMTAPVMANTTVRDMYGNLKSVDGALWRDIQSGDQGEDGFSSDEDSDVDKDVKS